MTLFTLINLASRDLGSMQTLHHDGKASLLLTPLFQIAAHFVNLLLPAPLPKVCRELPFEALPHIMGQRHQLFVIAKVKGRYRTLCAIHHQWLYGHTALRRCLGTLKKFQVS